MKLILISPLLKNLGESSYPPALHLLGNYYLYGIPPYHQDFKKAKKYFKNRFELVFEASYSKLGFLYHYGLGVTRDYAKSSIYHSIGCQKGNSHSCLSLSYSYAFGYGAPHSYKYSSNILLPISSSIIVENLAGRLTQKHIKKLNKELKFEEIEDEESDSSAFSLLKYKISLGDKEAEIDMGKVYYYGKLGQEVNKEAARQIFEKHQDDAISLVHLGRIHHLGEGVPVNLDKAKEYYERAVEMNEPNAMNILGVIKKSEGDPEGAKLIERASELGHDGASFNIAISEINNPETRDKAYKTLKKLTRKGILEANHYVAEMLLLGSPKFNDRKALSYLFTNIQFGPWIDNTEIAEEFYKKRRYETSLILWLELSECGIPVAAYNSGLMLYKWEKLSKENIVSYPERLKISLEMFRIINIMTTLDVSEYLYQIYMKLNKTEKAKNGIIEASKTSTGYFHIILHTLEGKIPFNLEMLFNNISKTIEEDNKSILPIILILPKIIRTILLQFLQNKEKFMKFERNYMKDLIIRDIRIYINNILLIINLIILIILLRKRVSTLYK